MLHIELSIINGTLPHRCKAKTSIMPCASGWWREHADTNPAAKSWRRHGRNAQARVSHASNSVLQAHQQISAIGMSPQICYSRFTVFWGPGQKTLNPARQRQRNFCPHQSLEKKIFFLSKHISAVSKHIFWQFRSSQPAVQAASMLGVQRYSMLLVPMAESEVAPRMCCASGVRYGAAQTYSCRP